MQQIVNFRSTICDKYVLFDIHKKSHETQSHCLHLPIVLLVTIQMYSMFMQLLWVIGT